MPATKLQQTSRPQQHAPQQHVTDFSDPRTVTAIEEDRRPQSTERVWRLVDPRDKRLARSQYTVILFDGGRGNTTSFHHRYQRESDLQNLCRQFSMRKRQELAAQRKQVEERVEQMRDDGEPEEIIADEERRLETLKPVIYAYRHQHRLAYAGEAAASDPFARIVGRTDYTEIRPFADMKEIETANKKIAPEPTHPYPEGERILARTTWRKI